MGKNIKNTNKNQQEQGLCTFSGVDGGNNNKVNLRRNVPSKSKNLSCTICFKEFTKRGNLNTHKKHAQQQSCPNCNAQFCNKNDLESHIRPEHPVNPVCDELPENLKTKIFPYAGGHILSEGYAQIQKQHAYEIQDRIHNHGDAYEVYNHEIGPQFTYDNLRELLIEILQQQNGNACKLNIGFGSVLYNIVTGEYRYHYNSSNSMLFNRAFTISNICDINSLLKRIIDLDLPNTYCNWRYFSESL